jgi:hypothetical protein
MKRSSPSSKISPRCQVNRAPRSSRSLTRQSAVASTPHTFCGTRKGMSGQKLSPAQLGSG